VKARRVCAAGAARRVCEHNWGRLTIALLYLIAMWAIIQGIFEIVTAIQSCKEISNEWALIIGGIIWIIFGVVLVVNPAAGAFAMVWVIGAYALSSA
jgi:uncharacterized membrane protein HdeD (DUF308 family)